MPEVDAEIESILSSVDQSTNNEIPMEATPQETAPAQVEQSAPPQEYEFESEGRKYRGDVERLKRWAQQGVSAPNKIGELAKKLSDYESKFKSYEAYDKTYKPIDEWAKANPDKWQSLFTSWQQSQYGAPATPQQADATQQQFRIPPELIQKIEAHDQDLSQWKQEKENQKIQMADQSLDSEINSIRKQYSNIDFDAKNQNGSSLEYQILEHATRNGIPSFRAAFRDYCFDQVQKMSESKGRETVGISPKTKAGLLGKDPTPAMDSRKGPDLRSRNYDQIHQLILQDMGLSG